MLVTGTSSNTKNKVWIISAGNEVDLDLSTITQTQVSGPLTEYRISDIARYLLNPEPIEMEEKVIGCRVEYKVPPSRQVRRFWHRLIFWKKDSPCKGPECSEDILLASSLQPPSFKDDFLNRHLTKINEQLLAYQPIQKKLLSLDQDKVKDITAIGEGVDKSQYQITIKGSIDDKIKFVLNALTKKAIMTIKKSYLQGGLFDFRGYDFKYFNPTSKYFLVSCMYDNQTRYCVLSPEHKFEYWVEDNKQIDYLHLFEQSIQTDPELNKALTQCIRGEAKPLKLFFSEEYEQDYSEKNLPMTYRNLLYAQSISGHEIATITDTLKKNQRIIFFTYVPAVEQGRQKLFTNISIMHDLKALDSIKESVPQIYSEIIKKTKESEAGKLYLLDSLKGVQDV